MKSSAQTRLLESRKLISRHEEIESSEIEDVSQRIAARVMQRRTGLAGRTIGMSRCDRGAALYADGEHVLFAPSLVAGGVIGENPRERVQHLNTEHY